MKLAIIGSRGIALDIAEIKAYVPSDVDVIISGGAKGIDTSAALYARKMNIKLIEIKPDYKRYGKAAPLIRNREIVKTADKVIIFWDGKSKGSKFVIDECEKTDKEYELFCVKRTK